MELVLQVQYPEDDCPTLLGIALPCPVEQASAEQLRAAVQSAVAEHRAHLLRLAAYRSGAPCLVGRRPV